MRFVPKPKEQNGFVGGFWLKAKAGYVAACCLSVLVLLGVFQLFFLVPTGDGQQQSGVDRAYWLELAQDAWEYYQPGKGVNAQTGLHSAGLGWPYFTEWDLGTYVQAIVDARELGMLQQDGQWGFDYRVEKVLSFLKMRKLTSDGVPYLSYDSRTGEPDGVTPSFCIDEGK